MIVHPLLLTRASLTPSSNTEAVVGVKSSNDDGSLFFLCQWEGCDQSQNSWESPRYAGFTALDMSRVHAFMQLKCELELERDRICNGVVEHFVRFLHAGKPVAGWVSLVGTCTELNNKAEAYFLRMKEREAALRVERQQLVTQIGFDPLSAFNDFVVGDRVQALYKPNGKYFRATVASVLSDGRFMIEWDDHDERDVGPKFGCELHFRQVGRRSIEAKRISHLEQEIKKLKNQLQHHNSNKRCASPAPRSTASKKQAGTKQGFDHCRHLRVQLQKGVDQLTSVSGLSAVVDLVTGVTNRGEIPKRAINQTSNGELELNLELLNASQLQTCIIAVNSELSSVNYKLKEQEVSATACDQAAPGSATKQGIEDDSVAPVPTSQCEGQHIVEENMEDDDASTSSGSSLTSDSSLEGMMQEGLLVSRACV